MDKMYLENPNVMYSFSGTVANIGNVRETIFLCWMKNVFDITESPISDFEVEGKKQILSAADGYIVADDIARMEFFDNGINIRDQRLLRSRVYFCSFGIGWQ